MVKRKMGGERIMLMLPLNVIMVAKVIGQIDSGDVSSVLQDIHIRMVKCMSTNVCISISWNNNSIQSFNYKKKLHTNSYKSVIHLSKKLIGG